MSGEVSGNASEDEAEELSGIEAVYLAQRDAIIRYIRARGGGSATDDIAQELWLKLRSTVAGPISDPVGYLFRAAGNLVMNHHRGETRHHARNDRWVSAQDSSDAGAENKMAVRDDIEQARRALHELGERVETAFILFRVEGLSQRLIANRLGVSLSTVERDLRQAYQAIAKIQDGTN